MEFNADTYNTIAMIIPVLLLGSTFSTRSIYTSRRMPRAIRGLAIFSACWQLLMIPVALIAASGWGLQGATWFGFLVVLALVLLQFLAVLPPALKRERPDPRRDEGGAENGSDKGANV